MTTPPALSSQTVRCHGQWRMPQGLHSTQRSHSLCLTQRVFLPLCGCPWGVAAACVKEHARLRAAACVKTAQNNSFLTPMLIVRLHAGGERHRRRAQDSACTREQMCHETCHKRGVRACVCACVCVCGNPSALSSQRVRCCSQWRMPQGLYSASHGAVIFGRLTKLLAESTVARQTRISKDHL